VKRFVALLLAMSLFVLAGCSGSGSGSDKPAANPGTTPTPADTTPKGPVTLNVSLGSDLTTVDPQRQGKMIDMNILLQAFDTLLTRDKDGKVAPNLATEWKALDDLTWQFKLRKDVKFHNGEPFNAEAVKFSIERLLSPELKSPIVELRYVTAVEVVDEFTVNIKTKDPDPLVPAKLTLFPGTMVPPKYIKEVGDDAFGKKPVGTGPFKFVEWVKDDHVTFEKNAEYWGTKASVDKLIFKAIPNEASRASALAAGDLDIATNVPADSVAQLKANKNIKIASVPGIRAYFVSLNTKKADSPFAKKEVRQALNYAVDVDTIIKTVLGNNAVRISTLIPPDMFGYTDTVKPYAYNQAKAKELLAAAGFPNGFSAEMDVQAADKDVALAIAGMLEKVGVKVKVNPLENSTFTANLGANKLADMYMIGNTAWTLDASNNLQSYAKSDRRYARQVNAEMDKLVDIEETSMDPAKRLDAFKRIQEILADEAYYIYLYKGNVVSAMSDKVTWEFPGTGVFKFNTAVKK
jgi:peptide/nickel transport system substrate-binding protein